MHLIYRNGLYIFQIPKRTKFSDVIILYFSIPERKAVVTLQPEFENRLELISIFSTKICKGIADYIYNITNEISGLKLPATPILITRSYFL